MPQEDGSGSPDNGCALQDQWWHPPPQPALRGDTFRLQVPGPPRWGCLQGLGGATFWKGSEWSRCASGPASLLTVSCERWKHPPAVRDHPSWWCRRGEGRGTTGFWKERGLTILGRRSNIPPSTVIATQPPEECALDAGHIASLHGFIWLLEQSRSPPDLHPWGSSPWPPPASQTLSPDLLPPPKRPRCLHCPTLPSAGTRLISLSLVHSAHHTSPKSLLVQVSVERAPSQSSFLVARFYERPPFLLSSVSRPCPFYILCHQEFPGWCGFCLFIISPPACCAHWGTQLQETEPTPQHKAWHVRGRQAQAECPLSEIFGTQKCFGFFQMLECLDRSETPWGWDPSLDGIHLCHTYTSRYTMFSIALYVKQSFMV